MKLAVLPKLEQATLLLAECNSVEEAKHYHDVAEAARQYARMNGLGLEAQNLATEIKIRAGRRAGELLKTTDRHKAGQPKKNGSTQGTVLLSDLGFGKKQSHKFQRLAAVPAAKLETYLRDAKQNGREITTSAVLRMGKAAVRGATPARATPISGVIQHLSEIAGQRFGTIYADPPWQYSNKATRSNVASEYAGTMTPSEVADMPVAELAAKDSHLHLWTTNAFIFEAKRVMDAWGFEYKSMFIWVKPQMGIGNYWRVSHEILLLGVRGDAKRFAEHRHKSWLEIPRGKHSAKPEELRQIIERVSPGPFLELFGRNQVPGWVVFGNQVESAS